MDNHHLPQVSVEMVEVLNGQRHIAIMVREENKETHLDMFAFDVAC